MKRPTWDIPLGKHSIVWYDKGPQRYRGFRNKPSKKVIKRKITVKYSIVDNKRLKLRKGDIIRFEKDPCHGKIPLYAIGQFAVILERYKIRKEKHFGIFNDYGAVIMMLTGKKKGYISKFSSSKMSSSNKLIDNDMEDF